MVDDFPSNSRKQREAPTESRKVAPRVQEVKKVERIANGEVLRRKKPLGKRFAENFGGTDAKGVCSYVFLDVLVPAMKDMVADATSTGIERILFGEVRSRARSGRGYSQGPAGIVSYNRYSSSSGRQRERDEPRQLSRRGRSSHDFDEIILATRVEAEEVLERLFDLAERYEEASVADLYDLVGIEGKFTDNKWGWKDMRGSHTTRVRNGYLLDLPRPEPLD